MAASTIPPCAPSGRRPRPIRTSAADGKYPDALHLHDDQGRPRRARSTRASSPRAWRNMACPSYYYENTEGGHAAGANLKQAAHTSALEMIYLTRT